MMWWEECLGMEMEMEMEMEREMLWRRRDPIGRMPVCFSSDVDCGKEVGGVVICTLDTEMQYFDTDELRVL